MLTHNPFSRKRNLTMDQRLQYQVTATHYLTGIAPLLLILVPPLQIYFNLTPMNLTITPLQWLLYYSGFYVLQVVLAFYTLGSFRWQVLLLAAVSFPIYTRALINAIFRRDQKWHVTGQKGAYRSPFAFMMPQVLFFQFLLITTVVGVWKDLGQRLLQPGARVERHQHRDPRQLRPHRLERRPSRPPGRTGRALSRAHRA